MKGDNIPSWAEIESFRVYQDLNYFGSNRGISPNAGFGRVVFALILKVKELEDRLKEVEREE